MVNQIKGLLNFYIKVNGCPSNRASVEFMLGVT
jgi:hypothetical protein